MISSTNSLTRFANSHIHQNVEEEVADIYLTVHKDDKTITLNSNITSIDSPKSLIDKALAEVENSPNDTGWAGMPESDSSFNSYKEIEPKNPEERAGKVKDFIEVGKDFNAAGYCSTSVDHYFVWNTNGLESSDSTTSAFIDGIFRTETSSGSSHRGGTSLEDIDSETAGIEAFKLAKDSQNPKDIDPGKYEVVLGPEAVSTILVFLGVYGFNARSKIDLHSIGDAQVDGEPRRVVCNWCSALTAHTICGLCLRTRCCCASPAAPRTPSTTRSRGACPGRRSPRATRRRTRSPRAAATLAASRTRRCRGRA